MCAQLNLSKRILSTLVFLFILFSNIGFSQHDSVNPCVENPPNHDIPNNPPEIDPCTFEYVYLNVDNISELGVNVTQKLNENIYIYKDLNIDKDFTFKDCTVKIAPDVKITITSSKKFRIDHSHLFTCYLLWEGIQVSNLSKLEILNQSEISDAKKAINRIGNSAQFWLNNSTYSNNKYCIYLKVPPTSADNKFEFLEFKGNHFVCNRYLKGTTNEITEAGIYLENYTFHNLSFTLTPSPALANNFVSLNYGIQQKGKLKKLNLKNYYFSDIRIAGIYSENTLLTCKLLNFYDCKNGIQTLNVSLADIKNCIFEYAGQFSFKPRAIFIGNLLINANVFIEQNEVTQEVSCTNRVEGIILGRQIETPERYKVADNPYISVKYNTFYAYADHTTSPNLYADGFLGIDIGYPTMPTNSSVNFYFNRFYLHNNSTAISSSGERNNFYVFENSVQSCDTLDNLEWSKCFIFSGNSFSATGPGLKTNISNNKILSLYPNDSIIWANFFRQGITMNAYNNAVICNNYFEHNHQEGAYVFIGDCGNTNFSQNIGVDGKFLNLNGGYIGQQYLHGNQYFRSGIIPTWNPNCQSKTEDHAKKSLFIVTEPRSSNIVTYPKHPYTIQPEFVAPNVLWWTYDSLGVDIECGFALNIEDERFKNSNTELIVSAATTLNSLGINEWYQLKYDLYNQVIEFPSSFSGYSPLNAWMSNIINTTLIDEYSVLVAQALNISKSAVNSNARSILATQMSDIGILLMNDTLLNVAELDSLYTLSDSLINDYQSFQNINDTSEIQKAKQLVLLFGAMSTNNTYEQVMKDYFNIYLQLLSGELMTQTMLNRLIQISELCILEYGVYPIWANLLIPYCYRTIDQDTINSCSQLPQPLKKSNGIRTNIPDEYLYNLYGQKVAKFNPTTDNLNQLNIQSGIYIYKSKDGLYIKIFKN